MFDDQPIVDGIMGTYPLEMVLRFAELGYAYLGVKTMPPCRERDMAEEAIAKTVSDFKALMLNTKPKCKHKK